MDYFDWQRQQDREWGQQLMEQDRERFDPNYIPTSPTIKEQRDGHYADRGATQGSVPRE